MEICKATVNVRLNIYKNLYTVSIVHNKYDCVKNILHNMNNSVLGTLEKCHACKKNFYIINSVELYESKLTQKSLSNQAERTGFCPRKFAEQL